MDNRSSEIKDGEITYPEGLKNKAYLMGLNLKNSGLEQEVIYARLEKQGIPEELALRVAKDVMLERKKDFIKGETPHFNIALAKIGVGILIALISAIVIPEQPIIPIGLVLGGVLYAIISKNSMK